jgi:hypothetical protein
MTTEQARNEFAKAVEAMRAAGVCENKIDDCKMAFEFTINPEFRATVAAMVR